MVHVPGFPPQAVSSLVNADVIQEHAEDAASLWLMHQHAIGAPLYRLRDLLLLDARLMAHLEALRTAGAAGKDVATRELASDDRSSAFVMAYLAFSAADAQAMRHVVQLAVADNSFFDAVVSALTWLDPKQTDHPLSILSHSDTAAYRRLAIAVLAAQRRRALDEYQRAATDADQLLRAEGLRAIGQTKAVDLIGLLDAGMRDADPRCRFWAAWSMALMGEKRAAALAYQTGSTDPGLWRFAIEIAMRAGDPASARSQIKSLAQSEATLRQAVVAAGQLGDPAVIEWLLPLIGHSVYARVAAEAFAAITGVDLEESRFKSDVPDDAPDEHDDDSDLRWPAAEGLSRWWAEQRARFVPGTRYLAGAPLNESTALNVLRTGYQRQRVGAAIEMACLNAKAIVFPVAERADRQQRRLQS